MIDFKNNVLPCSIIHVSLCFDELNKSPISVGRLVLREKKIWFEYSPDFISKGFRLSPFQLPLQMGAINCEDRLFQGMFGLFDDSLPDGWGRLLLDRKMRSLGVSAEKLTPLDRLVHVGKNGMGALCYEPEMREPPVLSFNLDHLAQESQQILTSDSEFFEDLLILNGSSGGARPKIMVGVSSDKQKIIQKSHLLPDNFEHWLIKFPSSQDPKDVGAIEWAYHLMAKEAGIDVPEAFLFSGKSGNRYFGCQRFDRIKNQRLHMHTLGGLLHADYRVPSLDYEDLLKVVYALTKNRQDLERAYRLAVFNVLAHNRDDHSKNFSFLMDSEGVWRFSPAYDLVFSFGPGGEQSMTVMGEGKNPSIHHLLKLAKKFEINEAKLIIDQVESSIRKWQFFGDKAGVSQASCEKIGARLLIGHHNP